MFITDTSSIVQQKQKSILLKYLNGFRKRSTVSLLILSVAGALRLIGLNQMGFNSDEAVYAGQAAAIMQDETLSEFFPVFRAHPLLFQFLLSNVFRISVSDSLGRCVSALFGILTVLLVYAIGNHLYGSKVGLFAAFFLAIMPYHIIVSRQVLLDGPMTFFATLTLYMLVRYATSQNPVWLYAVGACMGLTFLTKETGMVLIVAIYAFFALTPMIQMRLLDLVKSMLVMALVMSPYPISLALASESGIARTQQYLLWQLFRRSNHDWMFYPTTILIAIGPLLILIALYSLWANRKENSWREVLLSAWIVVPFIFFQSWPVKGYHYLLIIAPPVAILASRAVGYWRFEMIDFKRLKPSTWLQASILVVIMLSLFIPSWTTIQPYKSEKFLAGSGGVPGAREAGLWLREHSPEGSTLMTIGPSLANILQFYSYRKTFGLSVSPNPLHRNPVYIPIRNPDLEIRTGEFQYLVWDAYSADRSPFFSQKLIKYAHQYNGRVVHTESALFTSQYGQLMEKDVIVIYEVRP